MPSKPTRMGPQPATAETAPDERDPIGVAGVGAEQATAPQAIDPPRPDDDEDDERDDEQVSLVDDDDEDEDLITFTAREAAGALATVSSFTWPFLSNYKRWMTIVGFGLLVETLFNVIMPLSLKYLIDDALGEEDFQALYTILGVLAGAGIITSIVAVFYERTELAAQRLGDRRRAPAVVRAHAEPVGGVFLAYQARRDPVALLR